MDRYLAGTYFRGNKCEAVMVINLDSRNNTYIYTRVAQLIGQRSFDGERYRVQ